MEALVRAITFCEDADEHNSSPNAQRSFGTVAKRRAVARQWTSLTQPRHVGRFVPDTEARAIEEAAAKMGVAPTYEAWLRAQTQSVDTEVNVQLGEYTLKKNTLQPLPSHISVDGDFVSVFGVSLNANPIQCVEVEASTHRLWLRLVGQRHDVQLWDADPRHPTAPFSRPYTASARESADGDAARRKGEAYASGLADGEQWIAHVLEPFRKQYLRDVELCLPDWDHSDQSFAYLAGLVAPGAEGGGGLKEVVVFRSPEVVHVYNVISHARRWYRSLIFSSDNALLSVRHAVDALPPRRPPPPRRGRAEGGGEGGAVAAHHALPHAATGDADLRADATAARPHPRRPSRGLRLLAG